MGKFHVSGSYKTWSGNIGCFAFVIDAADHDTAMAEAERRVKGHKGRRYMGGLSMSASQYGEG